jgi:Ni/Fe-hydrogenase subunit HybB-like protein
MSVQTNELPYGVGRVSRRWIFFIVILLALIAIGIYAYAQQLITGEIVTGMRDIGTMAGAPWGVYITFVVYFVGVSFAGITIAALIRLLNLDNLKPVARMAEVLTVIALILGALCIIADVGQPGRALINLFRYARPGSPFFGTFTLVVSGYLFASLVYLYLDGRRDAAVMAKKSSRLQWFYHLWAAGYNDTTSERTRHTKTSFWLAIAILPLLVAAHSTLGFVFGLQVGRPGWFGTLQAPAFVVMAGISGIGMLMIIAAILRKTLNLEEKIEPKIFTWLGGLMGALILVYLYFMVTELLTTTYAANQHEVSVTQALVFGEYAWIFWGSVLTLVLALVIQLLPYLPLPAWFKEPEVQRRFAGFARLTATGVAAILIVMVVQAAPFSQQAMVSISLGFQEVLPWIMFVLVISTMIFYAPVMCQNVIARSVVSGLLVILAAIGKRYLIVIPSQTHGTLLPYGAGTYSPTWVEYSIVIGLFALGALLYTLFIKIFPILEVEVNEDDQAPAPAKRQMGVSIRSILAWGMVIGGFALQGIAYFFLAAPLGVPTSPAYADPRVPFAPLIFIFGVMLVFMAAVVYEVLPEKERA